MKTSQSCGSTTASFTQLTMSFNFCRNYVLQVTSGMEDPGEFNSKMSFYLLAAYVTVFLVTIKGVRSSGKVCC